MADKKYFIGGVGNAYAFAGEELLFKSQTLIESSIEVSVDKVEVAGGIGAKLLGNYYHTSRFNLTMTDALFDLNYIALNTGSTKEIGGMSFNTETVTLGAGGAGTITGTPMMWVNRYIGWVRKQGESGIGKVVEINGKDFTFTGGTAGEAVCIEYPIATSGESITIPSTIIPSTIRIVLNANLYVAGATSSQNTKVGEVIIDIPAFQLEGKNTLSMTSTGVAQTNLSGMALSVDQGTCGGEGYYAKISTQEYDTNWYDRIDALAFNPSMLNLVVSGANTAQISTLGIAVSTAPYNIPTSELTYTTADAGVATVSAGGIVTGVAAGDTSIEVKVTAKPSLVGSVVVKVTA